MVFLGIDWAEAHNDVCLMNEAGAVLARLRTSDTSEAYAQLQTLLASHSDQPEQILVAVETPRGLLVRTLRAAGYSIYPINPMSLHRYRERHSTSGAKSDRADAKLLADIVRTDRHNLRLLPEDSDLAESIRVLARSHKSLIWTRQGLQNQLRNALREFFPAALEGLRELDSPTALAVLSLAPTPERARALSRAKLASSLRQVGYRRLPVDAAAERLQEIFRRPWPEQPALVANAYGASVASLVALLKESATQIEQLEKQLASNFEMHPDAEIYRSLAGLGVVLGARVLGEYGDDPTRFRDSRSRKNYSATSPITKTSGNMRTVLRRIKANHRLSDAWYLAAFAALRWSSGANAYYRALRRRGVAHRSAIRRVANRLVGILDACLRTRTHYCEAIAWPEPGRTAA